MKTLKPFKPSMVASLQSGRIAACLLFLALSARSSLAQIPPQPKFESMVFSPSAAARVNSIMRSVGKDLNFQIREEENGTVSASIEEGERFIIVNPGYLDTVPEAIGLMKLSFAIGHHVNEHQFIPEFAGDEALSAAEFAGFSLYHLDAQRELMGYLPEFVPELSPADTSAWVAALERGFDRAEASFLSVPHSGYGDDGSGALIKGVPEFPFPPAPASAAYDLTRFFEQSQSMGDIDAKLSRALKTCGYYESRYFQLKGGFALVTRIEQFNQDGTCRQDGTRWSAKPEREETFTLKAYLNYFTSLFVNEDSYFRVFAFVVTSETWAPDPNRTIDRDEAMSWLNEGANSLPPAIKVKPKSPDGSVVAMVYEFKVTETKLEEILSDPSKLLGITHLEKSKILNQITP